MRFSLALMLTGMLLGPAAAVAEDKTTIVYVYPTSPAAFVPVVGLPSFLMMPGAPLPEVPAYVVRTTVVPAMASYVLTPVETWTARRFPAPCWPRHPTPTTWTRTMTGSAANPRTARAGGCSDGLHGQLAGRRRAPAQTASRSCCWSRSLVRAGSSIGLAKK